MKSKILNIALYSLIIVTLFGCAKTDVEAQNSNEENTKVNKLKKIETFEVAEHLVFCEQMVPRKCLYVKRENKKDFRPLWDEIENFEFVPGYKYVLKVEVEKIKYPPKDTSGFKYYLKEVVSRKEVENEDKLANLFLSKWRLTQINGEKVEENTNAFMVFEKGKETFYGNTACNSIRGKFDLDGDSIAFSSLRQSKRACPNMQKVEFPFTGNLGSVNKLKVETDRLYLYRDGILVLEFESNWER